MEKSYYKSPIGNLEIICKNNELVSLKIVEAVVNNGVDGDFIKKIKLQLNEYFLGKRQNFDIKINPKGTEFQRLIWNQLLQIPYGKTKSYSEIAIILGKSNAQRAVGSACNKNPIMIIIPCHRVISKNGKLCGFAYGNIVKQKLLEIENFANNPAPLRM